MNTNAATLETDTEDTLPLRELVKRSLQDYLSELDGQKPANLYDLVMKETEIPLLQIVLYITGGNQSEAAKLLGINRGTLRKKLQLYKLD